MTPICLRMSGSETVNVTAFPANHCPGSVMFLFDGSFGKYFYTGDFRYTPLMNDFPIPRGDIERVFLDTTFCIPYWVFPTKDDSIQQIVTLINSHDPTIRVFLECSMLGTEVVLASIAKEYGTKIFVEKAKFAEFSLIPELSEYLTSDPTSTRFHACAQMTFSSSIASLHSLSYVASYQFKTRARGNPVTRSRGGGKGTKGGKEEKEEVLCIKPSVQWFRTQGDAAPAKYFNQPAKVDGIWHVMFSIHSSFPELVAFVNQLAPKTVTPITTTDRAGFHKLLELTKTNVLYLNDKNDKKDKSVNSKENIPVPPPMPPKKSPSTTLNAPKWKYWNQAEKKRTPKKAKIEPLLSQTEAGFTEAMLDGNIEAVVAKLRGKEPASEQQSPEENAKSFLPPPPSLSMPPSPSLSPPLSPSLSPPPSPSLSLPPSPSLSPLPSPTLSPPPSPPHSFTQTYNESNNKNEEQVPHSPIFNLFYQSSDDEEETTNFQTTNFEISPKTITTNNTTKISRQYNNLQDLPTQDIDLDETYRQANIQELPTQDIDLEENEDSVKYFADNEKSRGKDDDPDRTPETFSFSDNDATPPEWNTGQSTNTAPTPVLIRTEEPRPVLPPLTVEERGETEKRSLLKQCNWDSDLDLSEEELGFLNKRLKRESNKASKAQEVAADDKNSDADESEKEEEEEAKVHSQTKKKKFQFVFPVT